MQFSEAILIIKEFFLEVLGFLLPGLVLWFMSFNLLNEQMHQKPILYCEVMESQIAVIAISYILGYIVYGVGIKLDGWIAHYAQSRKAKCRVLRAPRKWITKACCTLEFKNELFASIEQSKEFESAKEYLLKNSKIQKKVPSQARPLRNLLMSYVPEADAKVYTFMFRSDLSFHVGIVLIALGIIGLLSALMSIWGLNPFKSGSTYIILYTLMILAGLFLFETRKRFFSIAHRIIFPIFLAKIDNQKRNS